MNIMEAKLRHEENRLFIDRRRIDVWLDEQMNRHISHLLYGCYGMGKTSTVYHYVKKKYEKFGYLRLDSYDNNIWEFQAYFREMIRRMGCDLEEDKQEEREISLLHEVRSFISWAERQESCFVFIFDGIQHIHEEKILETFYQLMLYGKTCCRLFFLCDYGLSDFWKGKVADGSMNLLYADQLAFRDNEILVYCKKNRMDLPERQKFEMQQETSGWISLLNYNKEEFLTQTGKKKDSINSLALMTKEYIYYNIWNNFTLDEKDVIAMISCLPYANDALMHEVAGIREYSKEILWMRCQGIIEYDPIFETYRVTNVIQTFLEMIRKKRPSADETLVENILNWYEKNGFYREAYLFNCILKKSEAVYKLIRGHLPELIGSLNYTQIAQSLELLTEQEDSLELLFLKGIAAIFQEDGKTSSIIMSQMYSFCKDKNYEDSARARELYLNLMYLDYRVDIDRWLDIAENVLEQGETIHLYIMNGAGLSICFGTKELSRFFMSGAKVQREYQSRFYHIICEEQRDCFHTAEAEYLIATNREKKGLEYIQNHINSIMRMGDRIQLLSIYAMLCNLYAKDIGCQIFDNNERGIFTFIRKKCDLSHQMAAMSYREYYTRYKENREYQGKWMYNNIERNRFHITLENVSQYRIHAQILMIQGQVKRAMGVLQLLEAFYQKIHSTYYTAESQFAQAVLHYENEKKSEALKIVSKAIMQGSTYHYVGIFTGFGKPGYDLIRMYQSLVTEGKQYGGSRKHKYFYGNILRATYEEYEDILIREAKKSIKNDVFDVEQPINMLTDMERMVIKCAEQGMSNQEIAEELNIKITTVKTHLTSIYRKLSVKNRQAAIKKIREN